MTKRPKKQPSRSERIAALNDALRTNPADRRLGRVMMTASVNAEGPEFVTRVLAKLAALTPTDFRKGNDPYGERDFESFMVDDRRLYFKVDYYTRGSDYRTGSPDPSDVDKTERVLTIMLACEY